MATKTKDWNSNKNQDIKGKFVGREVFCNVNQLMENQKDWENGEIYEEIDNIYVLTCSHCGEEFSDRDLEICPDCGDGYELENMPQEIFEWWAVTNYLAEKLKAMGQPIYDSGSVMVWGRCCTGQAILLDGTISRICEEMEILEGQPNEWSTP